MQQRRNTPLYVLLLVVILIGGLFGLSYVYTPAPQQTEMVKEISTEQLTSSDGSYQPAEYP